MKPRLWLGSLSVLGCVTLLLTAILVLVLLGPPVAWYIAYYQQAAERLPQYDAQNDAVLATLPMPDDALEVARERVGIDNGVAVHGRQLLVWYSTAWQREEFESFYEDYFRENGWTRNNTTLISFYKLSTCVSVSIPFSNEPGDLFIAIYHDYLSQPFAPTIPVPRFNLGGDVIVTCP